MVEKVSWWDLPPYLEVEDLNDDPEARIGTGEGEMWSQGEAAEPVYYNRKYARSQQEKENRTSSTI